MKLNEAHDTGSSANVGHHVNFTILCHPRIYNTSKFIFNIRRLDKLFYFILTLNWMDFIRI